MSSTSLLGWWCVSVRISSCNKRSYSMPPYIRATCEAGSVRGSGWISVKGMNGTTVDPGCKQVRPELEHCVDTNATKGNETNTNATGKQSQTNATTMGNLTEPAATTGAGAILFTVYFFPN